MMIKGTKDSNQEALNKVFSSATPLPSCCPLVWHPQLGDKRSITSINTQKWTEEKLTDTYNLNRFVQAQEAHYAQALAEIKRGQKQSHWMWYVCPQYEGLGFSPTSKRFSIKSVAEAEAYLDHPVLGPRLREFFDAVMGITKRSAHDIFGSPDDLKLKSCATLFASISPAGSVFDTLLDRYFNGERDNKTLELRKH